MSNTLNEKEREEVSRIAYGYEDHPESDMDRLRKLDAKAKRPAQIFAYTFGILGALVLGVGIAVSFIGAAIASLSHPVYTAILKRRKRKYAARILELSETLLEEKRDGDTSARS